MAKSASRGAGPGTNLRGGVRSTMDPPFTGGASKGSQTNMTGSFDKPRSGGDNGLPTRVTDRMGGAKSAPKVSSRDSLGTVLTEGSSNTRR